VTVTGQDDAASDGDIAYTIELSAATSTDAKYNGLNPDDVSLTNLDDDIPGFIVSNASGPATTEDGGAITFSVALKTTPVDDVTILVSSSDPGEGTAGVSSLVFTPSNWGVAQTVTVTGQDDDVDDGDVAYSIVLGAATSTDSNYSGVDADDVNLTNLDDADTAGITVSSPSGITTTEGGGSVTFTVQLDSEPTSSVTIPVSSSDSGEGTAGASPLVFTPSNWDVAQTVTVTGQDDAASDGDIAYTIELSAATSTDAKYNGLNPDDVSLTNLDDDTTGPVTLFEDSFEVNQWNDKWVEDSQNDWYRTSNRSTDGNYSAEVNGRANEATLTSHNQGIPIDISSFGSATLSFDWRINKKFDSGEFVAMDVSIDGGGTWTENVRRLNGNVDKENSWHSETVDLIADGYLSSDLKIRFRCQASGRRERANLDNVLLVGDSSTGLSFSSAANSGGGVSFGDMSDSDSGAAFAFASGLTNQSQTAPAAASKSIQQSHSATQSSPSAYSPPVTADNNTLDSLFDSESELLGDLSVL
jgi:hypothetical protein